MSDSLRRSLRGTLRATCVAGFAAGALVLAAASPALATDDGHGKRSGQSKCAEHGKYGHDHRKSGGGNPQRHDESQPGKTESGRSQSRKSHQDKSHQGKPESGKSHQDRAQHGNNGTVEIDGPAYGDDVRNESHVSCEFQIKFFGFDAGRRADITLTGHAPTGPGVIAWQRRGVLISDDAAGGAGRDADAVLGPITLGDLALGGVAPGPHGYHLRLTVNVLGAPGGAKHKVFWLEPCDAPAPVPTATPVPGDAGATTPATPAPPSAGASPATADTGSDASPAVLGESVTRAAEAQSGIAGLPVTGTRLLGMAAAGLLLLLGGIVLVRLSRRHRDHPAS